MRTYETVSEAINDLVKRGYDHNFNLKEDCVYCDSKGLHLKPEEFEIEEVYRFEGETDPADESIVYAISALHHSVKGVLVNAYGTYSDSISAALVAKLSFHT